MSNLSILEQNILHSFQGVTISDDGSIAADMPDLLEEMEAIFLRFKDRDLKRAEQCATEWATVGAFLKPILPVAAMLHQDNPHAVLSMEDTVSQVRAFIKERLVRMHFPNNTNTKMERVARS